MTTPSTDQPESQKNATESSEDADFGGAASGGGGDASGGGGEHILIGRRLFWLFLYVVCNLWVRVCYRFRSYGAHHIPMTGPVLLIVNHQSYFDPMIMGVSTRNRPFFAMAKRTLWRSRILGWLIIQLNGIPLDQENGDIKALRLGVEALRDNHMLLVFAEGARTQDGAVAPFAPGVLLLIRRAKPTIVPVAIEGAFDVWPRGQKRPRLFGRLRVNYGEPISADRLPADKDEALQYLHHRVELLRRELASK